MSHDEGWYPGDLLALTDPPEYPAEWESQQRLAAYWHVIRTRSAMPRTTQNWYAVLRAAQSAAERHREAVEMPPQRHTGGRTPPPACDRTPEPDRDALRANQSPDREDHR